MGEVAVDSEIMEAFLGKRIRGTADRTEFWIKVGYDYASVRANYEFPRILKGVREGGKLYEGEDQVRGFAGLEGMIKNDLDFKKYPWLDPYKIDYSTISDTNKHLLTEGIKIISGAGGR